MRSVPRKERLDILKGPPSSLPVAPVARLFDVEELDHTSGVQIDNQIKTLLYSGNGDVREIPDQHAVCRGYGELPFQKIWDRSLVMSKVSGHIILDTTYPI